MNRQNPECENCKEEFDEESHCPRMIISCEHTCCTECITNIFIKQGKRECPYDRKPLFFSNDVQNKPLTIDDFPKNYEINDLLTNPDRILNKTKDDFANALPFVKLVKMEEIHIGGPSVEEEVWNRLKMFFEVSRTEEGFKLAWKDDTFKIPYAFKASLNKLKGLHGMPFCQFILGISYKVYHDDIQVFNYIIQFNQLRILSIDFNQNQNIALQGTDIINKSQLAIDELYLDYFCCKLAEIPAIIMENKDKLTVLRLNFSHNELKKIEIFCAELKKCGFLQKLEISFALNTDLPIDQMIDFLESVKDLNNLKSLNLNLEKVNCINNKLFNFLAGTIFGFGKLEEAHIDTSNCKGLSKQSILNLFKNVKSHQDKTKIKIKLNISGCDFDHTDLSDLDKENAEELSNFDNKIELKHNLEELLKNKMENDAKEKQTEEIMKRRVKREVIKKYCICLFSLFGLICISLVASVLLIVSFLIAGANSYNLFGNSFALVSSGLSALLFNNPLFKNYLNNQHLFLIWASSFCSGALGILAIFIENDISEILSVNATIIFFFAGCLYNLGLFFYNSYKLFWHTDFKKVRVVSAFIASFIFFGCVGLFLRKEQYFESDHPNIFYVQFAAACLQMFSSLFDKRYNNLFSFINFILLEGAIVAFAINGSKYSLFTLIKYAGALSAQIILTLLGPAYDCDKTLINRNKANKRYLIASSTLYFIAFIIFNLVKFVDCLKDGSSCLAYGLNLGTPILWFAAIIIFLKTIRDCCLRFIFITVSLAISIATGVLYSKYNKGELFSKENGYYPWMTLYWSLITLPFIFTSQTGLNQEW